MNYEGMLDPETVAEARKVSRRLRPSRFWRPMKKTDRRTADGAEMWQNYLYIVTARNIVGNPFVKSFGTVNGVVLGIHCPDGEPRHDWREFQRIKNDIVGPEWEAVELYPAESRLLDPSNYYMLWCWQRIPIGKDTGRVIAGPVDCIAPQRGWTEDDEPPELAGWTKIPAEPKGAK
jgi:hypothetical protein